MAGRLAGRVAFITGSGMGIGREAAVLFAEEGAGVVVADIDAKAAKETVALVERRRRRAPATARHSSDRPDRRPMVRAGAPLLRPRDGPDHNTRLPLQDPRRPGLG